MAAKIMRSPVRDNKRKTTLSENITSFGYTNQLGFLSVWDSITCFVQLSLNKEKNWALDFCKIAQTQ